MNKFAVIIAGAALLFAGSIASAADAKTAYDKSCASCHGKDGKGQTPAGKKLKAKDYTDASVQAAMTDEEMVKAVKEGIQKDGKTIMKGFGDKLSDDEIKALIAYIRSFKS
jgi:cytochrome c6